MTFNHYQPPSSRSGNVPLSREGVARPVGISILAFLHLIGGVVLLGTQVMMFANFQEVGESLRSVGISPMFLAISVMFLVAQLIGGGAGMMAGEKWGWWLGSFYYAYSIFRSGSAVLTAVAMADNSPIVACPPWSR